MTLANGGSPTLQQLVDIGLVPAEDCDLRRLYQGADGPPTLGAVDYLTLRDLCELSGCAETAAHALLLCLFLASAEGSSCVRLDQLSLRRWLTKWLAPEQAAAWGARIAQWVKRGGLPQVLAGAPGDFRPIIRSDKGNGEPRVYFHRYWKHESALREGLLARITNAASADAGERAADLPRLRGAMAEVLDERPASIAGKALSLNPEQQIALVLAMTRRLLVISGGPGTGKTSTIFTLLRCLLRIGVDPRRIALAAPTGRAAQRVTDFIRAGLESIGGGGGDAVDDQLADFAASTLHRLLRYNPGSGGFVHGADNPLAVDVVIVDEVSMVDVILMSRLLDATPPRARLVLLGDKDQLPSVEGGTVLADLMPPADAAGFSERTLELVARLRPDLTLPAAQAKASAARDSAVILRTNYRSQTHIQAVAARVNAQDDSVVAEMPSLVFRGQEWPDVRALLPPPPAQAVPGGCWLLEAGDEPGTLRRALDAWARHHLLDDRGPEGYVNLLRRCARWDDSAAGAPDVLEALFSRLNAVRILTVVREGPYGSTGVNGYVARLVRDAFDPATGAGGPGGGLFHGAPVMVTSNDHLRQVYNGDVGVVLRDTRGSYQAAFPRFGGATWYPLDALPAHELAFASTVHKGQGSEYEQVMLVLPPDGEHRLLTKEIVYTGVTRAKQLAIVCARADVLRAAIRRKVQRDSGLELWS